MPNLRAVREALVRVSRRYGRVPDEAELRSVLGVTDTALRKRFQARIPGDVELVFFQGDAKPGSTPQVVFGLADGGIDATVAALAERGVEIVTPVTEAPGGWSADFRDPDGHLLSLYQDGALPR